MTNSTCRMLIEAGIIFCVGVVLGLSFNTQLVMDAFSGKISTLPHPLFQPLSRTGPTEIAVKAPQKSIYPVPVMLDEVRQLLNKGAVAVDARAPEIYASGHLPHARSLPLGEVDSQLPGFKAKVPFDTVLITYCSGYGCPDSFDLGVRLLAEGYQDVRVYEGGLPEWRDADLPVEKSTP